MNRGRWLRRVLALGAAVQFCSIAAGQQNADSLAQGLTWDFAEASTGPSVTEEVAEFLTPRVVLEARRIRAYVRDGRFEVLRKRDGDLRAADAIYVRALHIAEYDIRQALLLSLLATLEHRSLPLRVPAVGVVIFPLSFEQEARFRVRVEHLPRALYPDSPRDEVGDRDKLQHFFGAAYVAYTTESPDVAEAAGDVVEWGEALAVVGGVDDPRDRRSNTQGQMFGHDLLFVNTMLPSDYLRLPVYVQ